MSHSPWTFLALADGDSNPWALLLVGAVLFVFFGFALLLAKRYRRCPSNKILIVYGKVSGEQTAKTLHGGSTLVLPLLQNYAYLDLEPLQIEVPLKGALSIENIRVNVPSVFTVAIGTDRETMQSAAVRLLGLNRAQIVKQAEDIIFGQLRQVIASMSIEEINRDREKFLANIQRSLEPELQKIGLELINVNITDITDESGYIEAIGRKAAAEAVQQAAIDVADQEKKGAVGVAEAERVRAVEVAQREKDRDVGTKDAEKERAVRVAELEKLKVVGEQTANFQREAQVKDAERSMRVAVADANAKAVSGENESTAEIAESNATLRVREAEAYQRGETRKREAEAAVLEAQYNAETKAAHALSSKIEAEKRAEFEAVAKARKAQFIVDAEAEAEKVRIEAEGEAAAIFAKLEAQARGDYELLAKKAQGLEKLVQGCGGAQEAFQLLMLEHLQQLSENAAKAISNIKFDKVVVWDGGAGGGKSGGTAGFLQSLGSALPPVMNLMKDIGGVELPQYFGKLVDGGAQSSGDETDTGDGTTGAEITSSAGDSGAVPSKDASAPTDTSSDVADSGSQRRTRSKGKPRGGRGGRSDST